MMLKKRFTVLFSLLLIFLSAAHAQLPKEEIIRMINQEKTYIYEQIILSKELQSDANHYIVTIPNASLDMVYNRAGYLSHFSDIEIIEDTISVRELKKRLPENYSVYFSQAPILYSLQGESYLDTFLASDFSETAEMSAEQKYYLSLNTYDIIKIYEPFDKWLNMYKSMYLLSNHYEVVIPVKHEYLDKYKKMVKENYLLFKVKLGDMYDRDRRSVEVIKFKDSYN